MSQNKGICMSPKVLLLSMFLSGMSSVNAETMSVIETCELIGPGPSSAGHPVYNDIQCGNGPANNAGDEDYCPRRVDLGKEGCVIIGPVWNIP